MNTPRNRILLVLLLLGLPCTALANAGTPLMWGQAVHLMFGNILIGVLEGNLLRWRIGNKGYHAVSLMILANYFSAICGGFLTYGSPLIDQWTSQWTLLNLKTNCLLLVILLWLATVLLEWPFVWFAMGREFRCCFGWALRCSFLLQSVSYLLLVAWYMLCGNLSLLTCKVVSPEEIGIPDNVRIYYISDDDVYKVHPGKESPVKIAALPRKLTEVSQRAEVALVFLADEENPTKANLVERINRFMGRPENLPILSCCAETDKVLLTRFSDNGNRIIDDSLYGDCNQFIGRPLGKAIDSNYRFQRDFYAEFGLFLLKRREGDLPKYYNQSERDAFGFARQDWEKERRLFALGSPIGMWWIRNIIQFENDTVLFEFPHNQICLYDYRTRRIALLARGYGSTALLER